MPSPAELQAPGAVRPPRTPVRLMHLVQTALVPAMVLVSPLLLPDMPGCDQAMQQVAWRLGPWSSFPNPGMPEHLGNALDLPIWERPLAWGASSLLLACFILAFHTGTFALVLRTHRKVGWPTYWPELRDSVDVALLWTRTALKARWIAIAAGALFLLLIHIEEAFSAAYNWIFNANLLYIVWPALLLDGVLIASALRRAVLASLTREQWRCNTCNYLLRGLTSDRCPECGQPFGSPDFRFKSGWKTGPRIVCGLSVAAMIVLPLAGAFILPLVFINRVDPDIYPIRSDATLRVRHGHEVALVRFYRDDRYRVFSDAVYWKDGTQTLKAAPDSRTSGRVGIFTNHAGVTIGPWSFNYSELDNRRRAFWLYRPDSTYEITPVDPADAPPELRWLTHPEPPTTQPRSSPRRLEDTKEHSTSLPAPNP